MFLAPCKSECQLTVESAERCRTRGNSHLPGREAPAQTATVHRMFTWPDNVWRAVPVVSVLICHTRNETALLLHWRAVTRSQKQLALQVSSTRQLSLPLVTRSRNTAVQSGQYPVNSTASCGSFHAASNPLGFQCSHIVLHRTPAAEILRWISFQSGPCVDEQNIPFLHLKFSRNLKSVRNLARPDLEKGGFWLEPDSELNFTVHP